MVSRNSSSPFFNYTSEKFIVDETGANCRCLNALKSHQEQCITFI